MLRRSARPLRRSLPRRIVAGLVVCVAFAAAPSWAARTIVDRTYQCTIIASTREFPEGLFAFGPGGAPEVNAWGQVAFKSLTRLPSGYALESLRVGRGEVSGGAIESNAVATASFDPAIQLDFQGIERASLDDNARITFLVYESDGASGSGQAIYRAYTNNPITYKPPRRYATDQLLGGGPYASFAQSVLDSNSSGYILFEADALYLSGSDVARREPPVQGWSVPVLHRSRPWFAFIGFFDSDPFDDGIWLNGGLLTSGPSGSFAGLSISGSALPVLAYLRAFMPGIDSWELAVTTPIGTGVWVDADEDPFGPFAVPSQTALNSSGEVAFVTPAIGAARIYVADGSQQIRRVVCQNQLADFGAPFFGINLSAKSHNRHGQIAFRGRAGLETFLVRADPLPGQGGLVEDCTAALEGRACDDGDPISEAICQAGICTNDPVGGPPSSCAGLPNETLCTDGDPDTISMCVNGTCVGSPLPVPEPTMWAPILPFAIWLGRRRREKRPD